MALTVATSLLLAGCPGGENLPGDGTAATTTSTIATTDAPTTTDGRDGSTTADPCRGPGDWLSLRRVDPGSVDGGDCVARFGNPSEFEQEFVRRAIELDCAVHRPTYGLGGDYPDVTVYQDDWCLVYVGVRRAGTTTPTP